MAAELSSYPLFLIEGRKKRDHLSRNQYLGRENNPVDSSLNTQAGDMRTNERVWQKADMEENHHLAELFDFSK